MSSNQVLELKKISKVFSTPSKGDIHVLNGINLNIEEGEFITIIGPSGCGKSTLLKIIAGLDTDYEGDVLLKGEKVIKPSIHRGFIFQEHRLFPWLTVEKNIAANLSLRKADLKEKVNYLIELVRLTGFENAYPKELSGGMSQRVAIARALLRDPEVLLLDEPFGALDAFTRMHLQEVLLDIWKRNKKTMIFVTHDIDESIYLANKVVVMSARPGTLSKVIPVELPYPRQRASPLFQAVRQKVLSEFEKVEELHHIGGSGI